MSFRPRETVRVIDDSKPWSGGKSQQRVVEEVTAPTGMFVRLRGVAGFWRPERFASVETEI